MYTKEQLRRLLIPLMFEQVLMPLWDLLTPLWLPILAQPPFPPFPLSIH